MEAAHYAVVAVAGYLIGSLPTGFLVARAQGIDIRAVGSGNIGATNAFRVLGKRPGSFVLAVDALKGFLSALVMPMLVGWWVGQRDPVAGEYLRIVGGAGSILGHNFPCWLKFKGGKGIATSAGVLLAWVPVSLGVILGVWLLVFLSSRIVSLASITAAFVLPFAVWMIHGSPRMVTIAAVVGALAIIKHRSNIRRLMQGTEPRAGEKKNVKGGEIKK